MKTDGINMLRSILLLLLLIVNSLTTRTAINPIHNGKVIQRGVDTIDKNNFSWESTTVSKFLKESRGISNMRAANTVKNIAGMLAIQDAIFLSLLSIT